MKQGWTYKPLGEVATLVADGDWIESKDQSNEGIRLIQTGNIGNGFFKPKDDKPHFISEETMSRLNCTEIFQGDCLVSRLPEPVGRACLIPSIGCRMITAVDCSIIRFGDNYLPQLFVFYSQSSKYRNNINKNTTGATRKRISRKNLETILIPSPSLVEQERIVEYLDKAFEDIDTLKDNSQKQLDDARKLFQAALTEAMQPKEGWEEKTIGELCKINSGKSIRASLIASNNQYFKIPCYGGNGLRGYVEVANSPGGCPIIGRVGAHCGNIHFSDIPFYATEHALVVNIYERNINPSWFCYILGKMNLKQYAEGAAQPVIAAGRLKRISLLIPSIEEQTQIVEHLDALLDYVRRLEEINRKTIAECDALKQSILRQIFE